MEGPRYVGDLLATGLVEEVLVVPDVHGELIDRSRDAGARVTLVDEHVLAKVADSVTPQGVVAVVRQQRASIEEVTGRGFLLVLHEVADPGNAGAVVRTGAAFGAAGIVFSAGSVDPWNPKAVRASAGAVGQVALVVDVDTHAVIAACRDVGQAVVALDAEGGTDLDEPGVLAPPVASFFGSEAHGLPDDVLAEASRTIAVPMPGPVGSLNLAATVAVVSHVAARSAEEAAR